MTFSLFIDQLVLNHWKGTIDTIDCFIMAFIRDLDATNEAIKERMKDGYFLITRKWLLEQLPILNIGKQTIYKRLKKLREIGLLDSFREQTQSGRLSYYKLSDYYCETSDNLHKEATASIEATFPQSSLETSPQSSPETSAQSSPETSNESTLKESINNEIEEEEVPCHIDADSDIAMQEHYSPASSSISHSLKSKEPDDSITECKRIIGEINTQQNDTWTTLLYHNTAIQTEFDRLEEGGKLDTSNLLLLAKQERSPNYFLAALRSYKGGKPVYEVDDTLGGIETYMGSGSDSKKKERTCCFTCGCFSCSCEDREEITTAERLEIIHDAEKLRERLEACPSSNIWRGFVLEYQPTLHDLVEKLEKQDDENFAKAMKAARKNHPELFAGRTEKPVEEKKQPVPEGCVF